MTAEEIVETIMTQHWDVKACDCWVCREGHESGMRPRQKYLVSVDPSAQRPGVHVDNGDLKWAPRRNGVRL